MHGCDVSLERAAQTLEVWIEFGITYMTHEADETGEPYAVQRDANVKEAAKKAGVTSTRVEQ